MSYTVLAVKWRPRRFAELVGQEHVVQALVNSLAAGRLHHAYLFAGTRGVGKTTVARILAKALNCADGVVKEPCGVCDACVAIDEGRFVDLIEVDAASRTRVDDTRELLDNVQYTPSRGRFKVYLIDEVHMLSNHSFNALLKTLEEPPPHVKFLLATTDPQKLPVTVLSRCLQFNLKKLGTAQIDGQLVRICSEEGVEAEAEGLRAVARAADGSMRDALSLLDQALALGAGALRTADVKRMLGTVDRGYVTRMLEAVAAGDGAAVLDEVSQLDEQAPDYAGVLDEMMGVLQQLAVIQLVGEQRIDTDRAALADLARAMAPEDVQLYYQIALQGRRDLPVSRDQRMGFEMTLLRMLAFRPATDADDVPAAAARARGADTGVQKLRPQSAAASASAASGVGASGPQASGAVPPEPAEPPAARPAGRPEAAPAAAPGPAATGDWAAMLKAADLRGPARQLAEHCALAKESQGRMELVLDTAGSQYNTEQVRRRLQSLLSEHLGRAVTLRIAAGEPPTPTPAQQRAAGESRRMRKAREAIENDPNVKAMQAAFDAVVEADSIQPMDD